MNDKNIDFGCVADLYDYYVTTTDDIQFYKTLCSRFKGEILELMCGTGRVSIPLIEAGFSVTCVDYSEEMLEIFRRKCSIQSRIICQDVSELDLNNRFEFAFIPFHSFSEITDSIKRKKAITKIREHLIEKGRLLITLYNPLYRQKTADGVMRDVGKFPLPNRQSLVVKYINTFNKEIGLITGTQYYELYNDNNVLYEKRNMDISFSLIDKQEIIDMAKKCGFVVEEIYGNYQMEEWNHQSHFMHLLFRKESELIN